MNNHQHALVPLEAWFYASPEVALSKSPIDIGLFCESLLYYDRVYLNLSNPLQFSYFISWFYKYHKESILLDLLESGILHFYEYAFVSAPVEKDGVFNLLNLQDPVQAKPNSFEERYFEHESLRNCISDKKFRQRLYTALRGRVVEKKAEEFGSTVSDAAFDHQDAERSALVVQVLVDELCKMRSVKPPTVEATIRRDSNQTTVTWNVDFQTLGQVGNKNFGIQRSHPLVASIMANRFIWSAAQLQCDLYLPKPISSLVGNKLYEATYRATKLPTSIESLRQEVEFPNVRDLVNKGKLSLNDIVRIRREARQFRTWIQQESERDRNAIIAYQNEVARSTGLARYAPSTLSLFGVIGSSVLSATVTQSVPVAVGIGAAGYLVSALADRLKEGWKPVVFGDWLRDEIARVLAEK